MDSDEIKILKFLEDGEKQRKEIVKAVSHSRDRNERTIENKLEGLEKRGKIERKESGKKVYFQLKGDQSNSSIATEDNIDHLRQVNDFAEHVINIYNLDPDGILERLRARFDTLDGKKIDKRNDLAKQSSLVLNLLGKLNHKATAPHNNSAPRDTEYRNLVFSTLDNILVLTQKYSKIRSEDFSDNIKQVVKQGLVFTQNVAIESEKSSEYASMFLKRRDSMMDILTAEDTLVPVELTYLIIEINRLSDDINLEVESTKAVAEYFKQVNTWDMSENHALVDHVTIGSKTRKKHLLNAVKKTNYIKRRQNQIYEIVSSLGTTERSDSSDKGFTRERWEGLNESDKKVLAVLSHGTNSTSKITELTRIPKPTVSKAVGRLNEKGWIEKKGRGVYKLAEGVNEYYQQEGYDTDRAEREKITKWINGTREYIMKGYPASDVSDCKPELISSGEYRTHLYHRRLFVKSTDKSFLLDDEDVLANFVNTIEEMTKLRSFPRGRLQENSKEAQKYLLLAASYLCKEWMWGNETVEYYQEVSKLVEGEEGEKGELYEYHEHAPALVRYSIRDLISFVDVKAARELFEEAIKAGEEPEKYLEFSVYDLYERHDDLDKLVDLKDNFEQGSREAEMIESFIKN